MQEGAADHQAKQSKASVLSQANLEELARIFRRSCVDPAAEGLRALRTGLFKSLRGRRKGRIRTIGLHEVGYCALPAAFLPIVWASKNGPLRTRGPDTICSSLPKMQALKSPRESWEVPTARDFWSQHCYNAEYRSPTFLVPEIIR